jgi:hypothetical protein
LTQDIDLVPLILLAGDSTVATRFDPDEKLKEQCEKMRLMAAEPRPQPKADALEKAQQSAARYGERPWLHMRYEMRIADQRVAVSWAPIEGRLPACVLP